MMCGINGIVPFSNSIEDEAGLRSQLRAMNQAIAHRGPDGEGEYVHQGVVLGHRRLSIPHRVLSQPKTGFNTPFNPWLQEPSFKAWIVELSRSASFRQRGIWSADKLQQRFERPQAHPGFPFWRFINPDLWARAYGISNL